MHKPLMTKKEALQRYFAANPVLVKLLELHRDGHCHEAKATLRGCRQQTVWNQCSTVLRIFDVACMADAVHHAMYFGIIAPKRHRVRITRQWSPELQHYHHKYIEGLTNAQKRELGL